MQCNCLGLKNPLLTGGFEHRILPHLGEFDLRYGQIPHITPTPPGGGGQHIDRCITSEQFGGTCPKRLLMLEKGLTQVSRR